MKLLIVTACATTLFAVGGMVAAWAVGPPEVDPSAGTFTGNYNFTPYNANSPCAGEDAATYVYDRISIKGTSVDSTGGDFSTSSAPGGMSIVGRMVFNQATNNGWARGTISIVNGTTTIAGAFIAVLGSNTSGTGLDFRGQWVGRVSVSGSLTGDITIENFEFNTPTLGAGVISTFSWGSGPTNANLSVKTNTGTC